MIFWSVIALGTLCAFVAYKVATYRRRIDHMDDEVRTELEELARRRTECFGPNIYDVYRPR